MDYEKMLDAMVFAGVMTEEQKILVLQEIRKPEPATTADRVLNGCFVMIIVGMASLMIWGFMMEMR